jgi:hypothetical protein
VKAQCAAEPQSCKSRKNSSGGTQNGVLPQDAADDHLRMRAQHVMTMAALNFAKS